MSEDLLLISLVFLVAGVIKGTIGIGLPTVSVALLTQFISPHDAVTLVVFPLLASNLWQVIRENVGIETVKRYGTLLSVMVVCLFFSTLLTVAVSSETLLGVIGFAVVVFAVTSLVRPPPALPDRLDKLGQVLAGGVAGLLGGLTSIWAPPVVVYLISRRTEVDEFVRAVGLFVFLGGIPLAIGFWHTGLLNGVTAPLSALMVIPAIIGFTLGELVRKRLNASIFRTVLLWTFLAMGLNLLRLTFFG